jgi:hypothetical protein
MRSSVVSSSTGNDAQQLHQQVASDDRSIFLGKNQQHKQGVTSIATAKHCRGQQRHQQIGMCTRCMSIMKVNEL